MLTLKQARKRAGLTQSDVANAIGVDYVTVSNWERGATFPGRKRLAELCKLYGVSVYDIDIWKGKEAK